jgi:hypothetical protein
MYCFPYLSLTVDRDAVGANPPTILLVRACLCILFAILSSVTVVQGHAQSPTSTVSAQQPAVVAIREKLAEQIRSYAQRHAKNNNSMQTQLVINLFHDNQAALTPQEIAMIYEEEYERLREAKKSDLWDQLSPNAGWLTAGILLLIVVFRDVVAKWIASVAVALGNWFIID